MMRRPAAALAAVLMLCATVAGAQATNWPFERPPGPLPARDVAFPPYEVRTLSNGLQVIVILHHEQPAVTMRLLVRAGAAQDPAAKNGVAYLAAHLLDQGTTTRSAQKIAEEIDTIGGALGTGSGSDLTFVNAVVMKDSFDFAMGLLADVVHNPAFAADEIERQKEQAISSLQVNGDDPDYIASAVFERLVYGFHPYGLPGSGTSETLAGITRQDLQTFHRRYFVPNNMILAIVGDVTGDAAFATAQRVFGGWPRGELPAVQTAAPPPPTRRLVVIDKPDAVQTEIRVGQLAMRRNDPQFLSWDLAVKILGGEGANRLQRVLRSERGLTYSASADTEAMKDAGGYVAETDTRTETTGEVLRLTVDEFARLQRDRVRDGELADAQAYLAGSFPLTIETPNDIATQVLNAVFYELPMQEIGTFRERVSKVTADDIQRVAREYIRPDRLAMVLVGNAQAFLPQLRSVGFTDVDVIPLGQLDLMSATLRRHEAAREAGRAVGSFGSFGSFGTTGGRVAYSAMQGNPRAGGDADNRAAQELLKRVIDAKGGLAALKAVRTVVADAETVLQMPQGPMASRTKTYIVYPDRFRVDASLAGVEVVQVYNAGDAWGRDPAGVHDMPAATGEDFAASVRRDTIPLLVGAAEGRLAVRVLEEEDQDGRPLRVLEISGRQVEPVKLYVDRDNVIARQSFLAPGPDGRAVRTEEGFSDYRTVSGVRVPFQARLLREGRPVLTRTLTNVLLNTPVADSLFARPR
jgi:zinc protease